MLKLVIVEDERLIRENLSKAFSWEQAGYEIVSVFENGKQAQSYIETNPVDAVLSDIRMPDMDGLQLAKWLHDYYPHIRIVLLTAYASFEYVQNAMNQNVFAYILKLDIMSELIPAMERMKNDIVHTRILEKLNGQITKVLSNESVASNPMAIAQQYMIAHCTEKITLESVAAKFHYNSAYFSRQFKNSTGFGFADYLKKIRMEFAAGMLCFSECSVSEIAEACGYQDCKYFADIFKERYGMSPTSYRAVTKEKSKKSPLEQ